MTGRALGVAMDARRVVADLRVVPAPSGRQRDRLMLELVGTLDRLVDLLDEADRKTQVVRHGE